MNENELNAVGKLNINWYNPTYGKPLTNSYN